MCVANIETYQCGKTGSSMCRVLLHGSNQSKPRPTSPQNFSGSSLADAKARVYAASDAYFLQRGVEKHDLKLPRPRGPVSLAFCLAAAPRVHSSLPGVLLRWTGARLLRRATCFMWRSIAAVPVSELPRRLPLCVCRFGVSFYSSALSDVMQGRLKGEKA